MNFIIVLIFCFDNFSDAILGCALGLGVLGIYGYSMFAVKQEHFLDDFEEPKKEEIN